MWGIWKVITSARTISPATSLVQGLANLYIPRYAEYLFCSELFRESSCSRSRSAQGGAQCTRPSTGTGTARARPHCLIGFPSPTLSSREFQTPATYPWKTFPPFPNNQSTNYFNPCPLSLLHSRGIGSPLSRLSYFKHNYISTSPVFWNIRS